MARKLGRLLGMLGAGLVGAVAALGAPSKASGDTIRLNSNFSSVNNPDVTISHDFGAHEGYNALEDVLYTQPTGASVDFYSILTDNTKLREDYRPDTSLTTFNTIMTGRDLTGIVNGTLGFTILDNTGIDQKSIYADIYKFGNPVLVGIDVKDYALNNTTVPLSLADGESYSIDVRTTAIPEPSTFVALAGLGLMGAGAYAANRLRRKE